MPYNYQLKLGEMCINHFVYSGIFERYIKKCRLQQINNFTKKCLVKTVTFCQSVGDTKGTRRSGEFGALE